MSGRPLPQAVIEEIQHRYSLIGRSPLTELTLEQGRLVEAELAMQGDAVPVYVGMRNWRPYIPDVVRQMREDGVEEAAVICLAPQNSRTSVGLYRRAVQAEAGALRIDFTEGWAQHPLLADAFAERLQAKLTSLRAETGAAVPVLFTAHSVPCRTVQAPAASEGQPRLWPGEGADPYAQEAKRTAELVAERGSRDTKVVVCISEPGRERRPVDWPYGREHAGLDCCRGSEDPDPAAGWLSLRSCGDSL